MWDEDPNPAYDLQQKLWACASRLDLKGVREALEAGAPPEPVLKISCMHGSQSPLALAVGSHQMGAVLAPADRLEIIELLLDARTRHPELPPPAHALSVAFSRGDALVLERLLPLFPDGIDTELSGMSKGSGLENMLMAALRGMRGDDSYPAGRLRNRQRLAWVLSKSPVLDCGQNERYLKAPGPMAYAVNELALVPSSSGHADAYVEAIDQLIAAGCPLGLRLDPEARRRTAAQLARQVALGHARWTPYLLSQVPEADLPDVEGRLKEAEAAAFRRAVLDCALDAQPAQGATGRPRM